MDYSLGAEEIESGRWIGWVFDLPGCVTYGRTREEALARAPEMVSAFLAWQERHGDGMGPLFSSAPVGVYLTETVYAKRTDTNLGNSRAFFDDDRIPMRADEFEQALKIMNHAREDLMAMIDAIPKEQLSAPIDGELSGSIGNILEHLAWGEHWYLDRLEIAFNREEMPEDPRAKLSQVRNWTKTRLRELVGKKKIVESLGEFWSPRKLMRRAIWHELDHIAHIAELLSGQISPNGRYIEM